MLPPASPLPVIWRSLARLLTLLTTCKKPVNARLEIIGVVYCNVVVRNAPEEGRGQAALSLKIFVRVAHQRSNRSNAHQIRVCHAQNGFYVTPNKKFMHMSRLSVKSFTRLHQSIPRFCFNAISEAALQIRAGLRSL